MFVDATLETSGQPIPFAGLAPIDEPETGPALFTETKWLEPREMPAAAGGPQIAVSRWIAPRGKPRTESATMPDHCHVVALALRDTWMSLSTPSKQLFEGAMPPGTIIVGAPGQQLHVRVTPPFDFLHVYVDNRFLEKDLVAVRDVKPFRDALAVELGRSLLSEDVHRFQPDYARVVATTIAMRAMGNRPVKARCGGLPKWRMQRLEQYLADNIDKRISLDDMAVTAGLSKMHFAAQFRAATGFRPHEYLLFKRIERAKAMLAAGQMSLVDVAFSTGFNAQAHFSTVFKRFTGKSPARWKQERLSMAA
jgi:AraC family transcriptional regulator